MAKVLTLNVLTLLAPKKIRCLRCTNFGSVGVGPENISYY